MSRTIREFAIPLDAGSSAVDFAQLRESLARAMLLYLSFSPEARIRKYEIQEKLGNSGEIEFLPWGWNLNFNRRPLLRMAMSNTQ